MRDGRGVAYVICSTVRDTQEPLCVCSCLCGFVTQLLSSSRKSPRCAPREKRLQPFFLILKSLDRNHVLDLRNSGSKVLRRYVLVSISGKLAEKEHS